MLMVYHNIYNSWSWLGGHADGEIDLLAVAVREVKEEAGISNVTPVSKDIFSVESLTVDGHWKNEKYVSSHLHFNVTYLLEADSEEAVSIKADENSGVAWFTPEEALEDIEYARAAIERRLPQIGARQSPFNTSVVKGTVN